MSTKVYGYIRGVEDEEIFDKKILWLQKYGVENIIIDQNNDESGYWELITSILREGDTLVLPSLFPFVVKGDAKEKLSQIREMGVKIKLLESQSLESAIPDNLEFLQDLVEAFRIERHSTMSEEEISEMMKKQG